MNADGDNHDTGDFLIHGIWRTFITEALMTFMFVSVVLNIKYLNGAVEDTTNAAAIGVAFTGMFLVSQHNSGACLNPAVGFV